MKQFMLRNKTFFRYLLSYLLLLILPLSMMTYLIFNNLIVEMERQVVTSNLDMLTQVRNTLDKKLNNFDKIALEISLNPKLTPYQVSESSYTKYEAVQELVKYAKGDDLIYQLFMYVEEDPYIYSSKGSTLARDFLLRFFSFPEATESHIKLMLNAVDAGNSWEIPARDAVVNLYQKMNFIISARQLPPGKSYSFGYALFFIDEAEVKAMIHDILTKYGGITVILNEQGEMIASSKEIESSYLDFVSQLSLSNHDGQMSNARFEFNGKTYIVNSVGSRMNDWSYITLVPRDEYLHEVFRVQKTVEIGIAVAIFIGVITAICLMVLNYRPIRRLRKTLELGHTSISYKDDVSFIQQSIQTVSQTNQELNARINQHRLYVRDFVLTALLKGHIVDEAELQLLLKESNMQFELPYFIVAIVADRPMQSIDEAMELETKWTVPGNRIVFHVPGLMDRKQVYILNVAKGSSNVHRIGRGLETDIQEQADLGVSIGVGKLYSSWREIYKSFTEASTALDYRLLGGAGFIYYEDITTPPSFNDWQPHEKLQMMEASIRTGNIEQMEKLLADIAENLSKQSLPLYLVRYYCFVIINAIMKVVQEMGISWEQLPGEIPDLAKLAQFESVDQLKANVYEVGISICQFVNAKMGNSNHGLVEVIKAYIRDNFKDQNFNFSNMATEIGFSSPYMSRYFKEKTASTMMDYLTQLRMEEICDELTNSDKLIKDVISDSGYIDIASFNRKFKKQYGVSPSEYRKLSRERMNH